MANPPRSGQRLLRPDNQPQLLEADLGGSRQTHPFLASALPQIQAATAWQGDDVQALARSEPTPKPLRLLLPRDSSVEPRSSSPRGGLPKRPRASRRCSPPPAYVTSARPFLRSEREKKG
uniref:Uncharacterized protein n=1 Tax=Arundo donax TaxID=35708 RepID=A0A0A9UBA6_ARUDO